MSAPTTRRQEVTVPKTITVQVPSGELVARKAKEEEIVKKEQDPGGARIADQSSRSDTRVTHG